jgi:hypothetical protein
VAFQQSTLEEPYSIASRLQLAKAYKALGYPDLAAGDAYKALILVDEVVDEGEYHEEALEAARTDVVSERMAGLDLGVETKTSSLQDDEILTWAQTRWSKSAYVRSCRVDALLTWKLIYSGMIYSSAAYWTVDVFAAHLTTYLVREKPFRRSQRSRTMRSLCGTIFGLILSLKESLLKMSMSKITPIRVLSAVNSIPGTTMSRIAFLQSASIS